SYGPQRKLADQYKAPGRPPARHSRSSGANTHQRVEQCARNLPFEMMTTSQPLPQWLLWVRRIQAISQTALTYAQDPLNRERYEELSRIAAEIIGRHSTLPEVVARACFAEQSGYTTPKIDVRAAIFRQGRILLVRERSDGLWTLPGGWADPGVSPSECAVK